MWWCEPSSRTNSRRLVGGSVRVTQILDDNELACDATGFSDELRASVRRQVVEEKAGEDAVELAVVERQRRHISLDHASVRHPGRGNLDHPSALVEGHQLAAQMLGEETRAACDIEHPRRGQRLHHADELLDLRRPTGPLALRVRSRPEPPAVVLGRTLIEMRTHLIVGITLVHLLSLCGRKCPRQIKTSHRYGTVAVQRPLARQHPCRVA